MQNFKEQYILCTEFIHSNITVRVTQNSLVYSKWPSLFSTLKHKIVVFIWTLVHSRYLSNDGCLWPKHQLPGSRFIKGRLCYLSISTHNKLLHSWSRHRAPKFQWSCSRPRDWNFIKTTFFNISDFSSSVS